MIISQNFCRCPYCGKILVRKRDLDRHIISRHSGQECSNENQNSTYKISNEEVDSETDLSDEDGDDDEIEIEENDINENINNRQHENIFTNNKSTIELRRLRSESPNHEISIQKIIDSN
jgi:DNA-directed RNA polymerase subunit M/transcription elongation factor TFIIS